MARCATRRVITATARVALMLAVMMSLRVDADMSAGFRVIANPANSMTVLDRDFLARVFLKKITRWPNGELIRPVDLNAASSVRRQFDERILGRSVEAVRNAWQQAIFSGRDVPPPELDSDEAVVAYVSRYPGAVGYVSQHASLNGAHAVAVR